MKEFALFLSLIVPSGDAVPIEPVVYENRAACEVALKRAVLSSRAVRETYLPPALLAAHPYARPVRRLGPPKVTGACVKR